MTPPTSVRVAAPVRPAPRPGAPPRRPRAQRVAPYLFIAPFLVVFVAFLFVPLVYALRLSLYADRLDGGVVYLGRLFRLVVFLPYAVPSVVAALMWGFLYGGTFGPFAQLAGKLDVPAPRFLSTDWMLASIANVVTWEYVGYNMIILLAALQAVPRELHEAAAIDGASGWQIARRIKVPMIAPALVLTTVFSIIGTLQLFNEPQIMTTIAPEVVGSSYTPNLYAYSLAFPFRQVNYSAAISFVLGAVVFVGSYLFIFATNRRRR